MRLAAAADGTVIADAVLLVGSGAPPSNLLYIHADHLGTPQKLTDADQAIVWDGEFEPFGEEVAISGTAELPLRFPGQYADTETGYSYNYFRDYDPSLGRYLQSDPIGLEGGLNTFAYVGGNPIIQIDPDGQNAVVAMTPWAAGAAAADGPAPFGEIIGGTLLLGAIIYEACREDDCQEMMKECFLTSLSGKPGSVYGENRCVMCARECERAGRWPNRAQTATATVRCDYWNYPAVKE